MEKKQIEKALHAILIFKWNTTTAFSLMQEMFNQFLLERVGLEGDFAEAEKAVSCIYYFFGKGAWLINLKHSFFSPRKVEHSTITQKLWSFLFPSTTCFNYKHIVLCNQQTPHNIKVCLYECNLE